MNARVLALIAVLIVGITGAGLLIWQQLSSTSQPRAVQEGSSLQATPLNDLTEGAATELAQAAGSESSVLKVYQCVGCLASAPTEDPFVAESEAEAQWMKQNAFPSRAEREWTDRVSLAEVEARVVRDGGDVWLLELVRKRCAVGSPVDCARNELGRAAQLADEGRGYAHYVRAESYALLAEIDEGEAPAAVASMARGQAPAALMTAALRGDGKAEYQLSVLMDRASRPWSVYELQGAVFSALRREDVDAAYAAANGRMPRQWPRRPSRSTDEVARQMIEWKAKSRASNAQPPTLAR